MSLLLLVLSFCSLFASDSEDVLVPLFIVLLVVFIIISSPLVGPCGRLSFLASPSLILPSVAFFAFGEPCGEIIFSSSLGDPWGRLSFFASSSLLLLSGRSRGFGLIGEEFEDRTAF